MINIKIINPLIGSVFNYPQRSTCGSAGIDLIACIDEEYFLYPNQTKKVSSGIAIDLDKQHVALLFPRSGLGTNKGIVLGNLTGIIDSDYKLEIIVPLWNRSTEAYTITPGERICQMIIMPFVSEAINYIDTIEQNERGGFGSTGK